MMAASGLAAIVGDIDRGRSYADLGGGVLSLDVRSMNSLLRENRLHTRFRLKLSQRIPLSADARRTSMLIFDSDLIRPQHSVTELKKSS
jgi:hypothetical protein